MDWNMIGVEEEEQFSEMLNGIFARNIDECFRDWFEEHGFFFASHPETGEPCLLFGMPKADQPDGTIDTYIPITKLLYDGEAHPELTTRILDAIREYTER